MNATDYPRTIDTPAGPLVLIGWRRPESLMIYTDPRTVPKPHWLPVYTTKEGY
jgi:hypothetical protein